eukprot:m.124187 g.124187  ORF g.124187 m.124187 type:complete len:804 (-) comp15696_c0_seq2:31-2442(-)
MPAATDAVTAVTCDGPAITDETNIGNGDFLKAYEEGIVFKVAHVEFDPVSIPYLITATLLLLVCARITFHNLSLNKYLPDSALTIVIGMIVGGYLGSQDAAAVQFDEGIFFHYLLPWIILQDGYFTDVRAFITNLNVILLLALLGTLFNTVAIATIVYAMADACGVDGFRYIDGLVFGSLIAAVDPVAVLAVFNEIHVNDNLYTTVLGESTLNDGIAIVLFRIFAALALRTSVPDTDVNIGSSFGIGIGNFIVVLIGGVVIGAFFGLLAAFIVMFSRNVPTLAPAVVMGLGYMSYLTAEIFESSGIIAVMVAGMTMQLYASGNLSRDAATGVQTVMHLVGDGAESIIFVVLGVELVRSVDSGWNTGFVFTAIIAALTIRAIGVYGLIGLINPYRNGSNHFSMGDRFILSYGGLRGAIAFALATILLPADQLCSEAENEPFIPFRHRDLFVSTTIAIVVFTVLVQGSTIRPLLEAFHVRHSDKDSAPDTDQLACQVMETVVSQSTKFAHALAGTNSHNILSWYIRRVHTILKTYFYHENVFRVRHAFEVLEDDIDATARRLIASVKDAQQSIANKGHLTDEQKIDKLADHVQDALHNAAGGVTDRLRNAQRKGALDDAWTKYDANAARPALRKRRSAFLNSRHRATPTSKQRQDTGYMPSALRRRQCQERHEMAHGRASDSSDAEVECEQLSGSPNAFSKAIKARHPEQKYVHRWRQHPTQPFGMVHDRQRQGHDEHNTHWRYLERRAHGKRRASQQQRQHTPQQAPEHANEDASREMVETAPQPDTRRGESSSRHSNHMISMV